MSSRTLFLDSNAATVSSSVDGEWTWMWPEGLVLGPRGSRVQVSLQLFSYYAVVPNIVKGRNNELSVNGLYTIEVPEGQYDAFRLADYLGSQLVDVTVTFDETTMRYTFEGTASFTLEGSLLTVMGWAAGDVLYQSDVDNILTSDYLVNLGGSRYLEVSTSLKTDNVVNADRSGLVLARIPVGGTYGELITYSGMDCHSTCLDHVITTLSIVIRDDRGEPVDFAKTEWTMSLYFLSLADPLYVDLPEHYKDNNLGLLSNTSPSKNNDSSHFFEKGQKHRRSPPKGHGASGPDPDQGGDLRHQGTGRGS